MANFTLETNRNTAITNIPRLTFQLPQSTSGTVPSTSTPIFFCQTGCQLEFEFKNITNATLKNDGNYFTIIPNDNSNNYINWNGTGVSGQNMTRFDLKEIKFSAPARDVVGAITYNKSIQFYLTFVNSTYTNIMIVISIIGQANNVGTAQTDGFILLNSLAPQIPLRNETKTVSNLGNVNLGNLLPPNKSFFSTLLNDNNLQYIFMTRIIDIPESFLNNLISRVIGSQQSYQSKVNQYTQQIPTNPQGTIIFYTENVKPISSDQVYVCNSNCDRVVGDSTLLQPTFGSSSTTKSESRSASSPSKNIGGATAEKLQEEECEEEYIFPGTRTNVNVKDGSTSSTSADNSNQKNLTNKETNDAVTISIWISILIIFIVIGNILILYWLAKAANVKGMEFFSRELWLNKKNIPWIIITFIGLGGITSCLIAAIFVSKEEISNNDDSTHKFKIRSWALLLIGVIGFYLPCIIILFLKAKNFRGINRTGEIGTNNYSNYPEISKFETLSKKIVKDYSLNPTNFIESSSGKSNLLEASKIYNSLPSDQKSILDKNNPQLSSFIAPSSKLLQEIKSSNSSSLSVTNKKELTDLIQSLDKKPIIVTPKIRNGFLGFITANPDNQYLKDIRKNVKIGSVIPAGLEKFLEESKNIK
jgi:hypothetical protein